MDKSPTDEEKMASEIKYLHIKHSSDSILLDSSNSLIKCIFS